MVDELTALFEPELFRAFMSGVQSVTDGASVTMLENMIDRGDIDGAVRAVGLDPAAFADVDITIERIYRESGREQAKAISTGSETFRFDIRNPEAEEWLAAYSSERITNIVEEQRQVVREVVANGMAEGRNPRTTALDIVGRYDRAKGRRTGGVIGLSAPQERYVTTARSQLRSGDPAQFRAYLRRQRRDKRFDSYVAHAIDSGRPVPAAVARRATERYSDRLLQLRGEAVARTETITALNKGRNDAVTQQIRGGRLDERDVTRTWVATRDGRTRDSHSLLHGSTTGPGEAFISPVSGASIMYPGDPMAPAEERIFCRCWLKITIDFIAAAARAA